MWISSLWHHSSPAHNRSTHFIIEQNHTFSGGRPLLSLCPEYLTMLDNPAESEMGHSAASHEKKEARAILVKHELPNFVSVPVHRKSLVSSSLLSLAKCLPYRIFGSVQKVPTMIAIRAPGSGLAFDHTLNPREVVSPVPSSTL